MSLNWNLEAFIAISILVHVIDHSSFEQVDEISFDDLLGEQELALRAYSIEPINQEHWHLFSFVKVEPGRASFHPLSNNHFKSWRTK